MGNPLSKGRMKTTQDTKQENTARMTATTNTCEKTNSVGIEASDLWITATLPKPPSINLIYKYTNRQGFASSYISKEGRLWFEEAGYRLKAQTSVLEPIIKPCAISIELHTAYITKQDGDNILKPTLDLLQKQGIIKNDALFYDIRVRKYKVQKGEEQIVLMIRDLVT